MKFETLLAKSCDETGTGARIPTHARLLPHLRAVQSAGEGICAAVGALILRQLELPQELWLSRLQRALPVAGLCHDIGKANVSFQQMVRGQLSPKRQPARHELLSALLLADKSSSVRDWALQLLSENGKYDDAPQLLDCVIGAVGGHHLKLDEEWQKASLAFRAGGCGTEIQMLLTHPNMKPLFGTTVLPELSFDLTGIKANALKDRHLPFTFESNRVKDKLKKERDWWRFAAALKALTAAADVVGSAVLSEGVAPQKWAQEALSENGFIKPGQMSDVVRARLQGKPLRPFQEAIGASGGRVTLAEAGCGSGKTAAAYQWAEQHAPGKKLFFCYPTTGTATEGFLGYVAETEIEAKLMHSRALVDLDGLAAVKPDEEAGETLLRVASLRAWTPQVVICTADTVLALVRNNRRGWYNSPAILSASFVFDELHAYDNRMFAAVIALIKALPGASFLLMTASLPKARKEFLLKHVAVTQISTPQTLEAIPRYLFELAALEEAFQRAATAAAQGRKVLWICNTVKQAQIVFELLKNKGLPVQTYHSRFKYKDRRERHRELIAAFGPEQQAGLIAVTTQVAEMSLDLDADVLISEIAPAASLIQRLGRLNRRVTEAQPGTPRTAYFIVPEDVAPYSAEAVASGQSWLARLIELSRPLSQQDLAVAFNDLPALAEQPLELKTEWLDSGWFARPGQVREAGFSVSVILPEDERACRRSAQERTKKTIPLNYSHKRMQDWREFKGHLIAPPNTIDYNEERGARWL